MEEAQLRPGYETARLKLARIRVEGREKKEQAAQYLARVTAEALSASRVWVWALSDRGRRLTCQCMVAEKGARDPTGSELSTDTFRELLKELEEHRALIKTPDEARGLGRLFEEHLSGSPDRSLLLAPIIRDGGVRGLILVEGPEGADFGQREIDFVSSVADLAALISEQADRVELEAAIQANAELLHEQQKSQALVRLSRAVGHDIMGLMQIFLAVADNLEIATNEAASLEDVREWATQMRESVQIGNELTEQLLTFGGERTAEVVRLDFQRELQRMRTALRGLVSAKGTLQLELSSTDPNAYASLSGLQQIVLNLVTNSARAIREDGTVTVRLREPSPEERHLSQFLILEVQDNGRGMDEVTVARATEPYFTTRKDGHGIGLATVAGAVRACGGQLFLSSQLGVGTLVTVTFPRFWSVERP